MKPPRIPARLRVPLVGAWYGLVVLLLTWPIVLHPGREALGSPMGDGLKHLWTLWWIRASVWGEGHLPFSTDLVNYPVGMALFPIEPLNGAVAALLPGLPLILISNLLVLANLWGIGLAGHLLGREVGGTTASGLCAGTMLLGSSVAAFSVHVGVGELLHLWWLPLGAVAMIRACADPRPRRGLALAGCMVGAILSSFYIGLFLLLVIGVWVLWSLPFASDRRGLLLTVGGAGLGALVVVLPVVRVFAGVYGVANGDDGSLAGLASGALLTPDPAQARLELWQLLSPDRLPSTPEEAAYGGGRYLGIGASLLALFGALRRPRQALPWLLVGATGIILALGSRLTWAGVEVSTWTMPFAGMNRLLSVVAEPVNFPVRFLAITVTAQAALAALALPRLGGLLGAVAALEIASLQMLPRPWQTFVPIDLAELRVLAKGPAAEVEGAVLDLGQLWVSDRRARQLSLSAQIFHERPVQVVSVERVEYFARQGRLYAEALQLYRLLEPAWHGRTANMSPAILHPALTQDLAVLHRDGFRWILVAERTRPRPVLADMVEVLGPVLGEPLVHSPAVVLWPVPEPTVDATELDRAWDGHRSRWRELQAADRSRAPLVPPDDPRPPNPPLPGDQSP